VIVFGTSTTGGVGVGGRGRISASCYLVFLFGWLKNSHWLMFVLEISRLCIEYTIVLSLTIIVKGNTWDGFVCLFVCFTFWKLYPCYMMMMIIIIIIIIIHIPECTFLCRFWSVTIPHGSRRGGARHPKRSMASLWVRSFRILSRDYTATLRVRSLNIRSVSL
jgi:hypothetical protein